MEGIFAGFIAEICDPFTVRRPRRVALRYTCSIGQISGVAFLGGYADDLTACFEDRSRAGRRDGGIADPGTDLFKFRSQRRHIAVDRDIDRPVLPTLQVVNMNCTELLI